MDNPYCSCKLTRVAVHLEVHALIVDGGGCLLLLGKPVEQPLLLLQHDPARDEVVRAIVPDDSLHLLHGL